MGKLAFVFPGQGSQHTGMGADLMRYQEAAGIFAMADEIRPGTGMQCFSGDETVLTQTGNTQPCLFAVEVACAAVLQAHGIMPDMTAGFSIGELAALACGGAGAVPTLFSLVCSRGRLMQEAAERHPAKMAAVLKLENETVEALCRQCGQVYPVNYNCPGQVTVSGTEEDLPALLAAVKAAGGRSIPLKVGGGFHSPFMDEAAEAFAVPAAAAGLRQPEIPVYANCTAAPYCGDTGSLLVQQIHSPVRWEQTIRAMIADGADTFLELGPGQTLCGMIRRIDRTVRTRSAETAEELEAIISELKAEGA